MGTESEKKELEFNLSWRELQRMARKKKDIYLPGRGNLSRACSGK